MTNARPSPPFAYRDLIRHAERFGTDCVLATANEIRMRESDRVLLKCELWRIQENARTRNRGRRRACDDTPRPHGDEVGIAVDRLAEDNLADDEIARRLHVSVQTVRRHLRAWGPHPAGGMAVPPAGFAAARRRTRRAAAPLVLADERSEPTPRRSPLRDRRRREVFALRRAGRVVGAIADQLGLSDATVRRYLRELQTDGPLGKGAERWIANPHG